MSGQRLGAKSIRRIERATGLDIVRAWSHGGTAMSFVATAHRHGWYDQGSGEWGFDSDPVHYTTCAQLFPEEGR